MFINHQHHIPQERSYHHHVYKLTLGLYRGKASAPPCVVNTEGNKTLRPHSEGWATAAAVFHQTYMDRQKTDRLKKLHIYHSQFNKKKLHIYHSQFHNETRQSRGECLNKCALMVSLTN